jgi:hypothetical protein
VRNAWPASRKHLDLGIECDFLLVVLLIVIRIHPQVVEGKLLLYPLLERSALLQRQAVTLCNDWYYIDKLAKLLQHDNINRLEGMARWLDEEKAAVDAGVLQVSLTLSGEFLAQVSRVLVLDVLDNGVPAALVVDQVAVAGGVYDVETETHTVFLNDMRDGLDLGRAADGLVRLQASLAVHEMRCEDGVDQSRLSETSLACAWWLAMRKYFDERVYEPTQMTLNWKPRFRSFFSIWEVMLSKPTWLFG